MTETECRSADWYQLGKRDGEVYGVRPQIDQYVWRCNAFGVKPQESEYMTGWIDGNRERNARMDFGGGPD